MKVVVADASAIAEYVLQTPRGVRLRPIVEAMEHDLHVPALCDVEIVAVLRRALLERRLGTRRAFEALEDYRELPLTRHGHLGLLSRALGLRSNFTVYDAVYVALAEQLGATLVTADRALAKAAVTNAHVPVEEV